MQNLSYQNEFNLFRNELIVRTHFHMNGFARHLNSEKAYYIVTYLWQVHFLCLLILLSFFSLENVKRE